MMSGTTFATGLQIVIKVFGGSIFPLLFVYRCAFYLDPEVHQKKGLGSIFSTPDESEANHDVNGNSCRFDFLSRSPRASAKLLKYRS